MKMKKTWGLGIAYFALGILASEFTQSSATPELVTATWLAVPAFIIFVLFTFASVSLGALVRSRLKLEFFEGAENGFFDLATGTALAYLLAYLLTPLHAFSSSCRILLWLLLAIVTSLGAPLIEPARWFSFAKDAWTKLLLAVPLLIVFLRLIEGLQFHLHGDAYVTYLAGPRVWAANGSFAQFLDYTQFFLCTSWETLYAWGTALMGLKGGAGLDLSQYFGQWCNGGIALLGLTLGSIALAFRISQAFSVDARWYPLVAVYALQIPALRWTANLGKNDMGVAFWGLAAFYFTLFLAPLSGALALMAGVLTGAAVIGKLTVCLFGVCLGIHILIFYPKRFIPFSVGGILGGLPVFIRNYVYTENPVFPWLTNHFPHPERYLSKSMAAAAQNATAHPFQLEFLKPFLLEIHDQLLLWPVLILAFVLIKNKKTFLKFTWAPLIATLIFTIVFRPSTEIRYQNVNLVALAEFICFFGFYLLTLLPKKAVLPSSAVFAVALVATANIPTFTLFQIGSAKLGPISKRLSGLTGGEGKLWIRQHLKPTDEILSMSDPHVYYTVDYKISEITQTPEWDDRLSEVDAAGFAQALLQSKFQYVYISIEVPYWAKKEQGAALMKELGTRDASCKVFANEKNEIWDLSCLRKQSKQ